MTRTSHPAPAESRVEVIYQRADAAPMTLAELTDFVASANARGADPASLLACRITPWKGLLRRIATAPADTSGRSPQGTLP